MTGAAAPDWAKIRASLPRLVFGVERAGAAAGLAAQALALAPRDPSFFPLGRDILLWNWRRRPLDLKTASHLASLERLAPFLPQKLKALIFALASLAPLAHDPAAPKAGDGPEAALGYLEKASASAEAFLSRLPLCMDVLEDAGEHFALWELCARVPFAGPLAPLGPRLAAELAFFTEPAPQAMRALARADQEAFDGWTGLYRACLAENMGAGSDAAGLFAALSARLPWHPGLRLLSRAKSSPAVPTPARDLDAAVLLYAWNSAGVLEKTLKAVMASDIGGCPVICLDNGSTDDTAAVIKKAVETHPGRIEVVAAPVNVGAPAARNWLLSLPQTRGRSFAAFVDDDALPPRDWLRLLHGAISRHPGAGAAGCRVADAKRPWRMQSADLTVFPSGGGPDEGFDIFDPSSRLPDPGLFAYKRACVSVTGCCHLVSRESIETCGPFDLRFSPSQFDDFERDLRAFLAGFPCVYEGRLTVLHENRSGAAPSPGAQANARGNRVKLNALYPPEAVEKAARESLRLAWEDFASADGLDADGLGADDSGEVSPCG